MKNSLLALLTGFAIWSAPAEAFNATYDAPEEQIIVIENFISPQIAKTLIDYYKSQKRQLNQNTDNQLTLSPSTPHFIQSIISDISQKIVGIMHRNYDLLGKEYGVDHFSLFARIPGNFCVYHADNIRFECPLHGADQSVLRRRCPGTCPGSKFVPNHTGWREYTGLVYLNEDFEGGEILFEDGPCQKKYRKVIPIQSGLLVLAPNGSDFYHEVFPMRKGIRYSLHFWYTSDPAYMRGCL